MVGRVLDYEAKTIKNEGVREGIQKGFRKGKQEGLQEGKLTVLFNLVHNERISLQEAASLADMSEEAFLKKMQENSK